jgi:ribosomal protein S25
LKNYKNDKLLKEVPKKMKVITVYNLVEGYKINGSLARRSIRELLKAGTIKPVATSGPLSIYTKIGAAAEE